MSPYLLASEARATLEMSTSRAGRAGGPMMLGLRLNTDREQDALRASVLSRRPERHTEVHETDEQRAVDFPGEAKYRAVEIPIPHSDPYRVAAVIGVDSVAAIDALRALLDEAEAALTERYPAEPAAGQAEAAPSEIDYGPVSHLHCVTMTSGGGRAHITHAPECPDFAGPASDGAAQSPDPWVDLTAPTAPDPDTSPRPSPIRPTPEQLEHARELVRGGTDSPHPISVAEATANSLGVAMFRIATAHAGCWRGERCGICRELGPALALFQVSKEKEFTGAEGGEPA